MARWGASPSGKYKLAATPWQQMCIHSTPQTYRPSNISTLTVHSSYDRRIPKKQKKKTKKIWHICTSSICWLFQHLHSIRYIYSIFMKEQSSTLIFIGFCRYPTPYRSLRRMEVQGLGCIKGKYPLKQSKVEPRFAFCWSH